MHKRLLYAVVSAIVFIITVLFIKIQMQSALTTVHKKTVVCTTGMIADVVRNVASDKVHVVCLMGPGIDPHLYRARAGDMRLLHEADLIVYNGLHLEGKMADVFKNLAAKKPVLAVAELLPADSLLWADDSCSIADPHVWHDVLLWQKIIPPLVRHLSALVPEHALFFKKHAEHYSKKLHFLHEWIKKEIKKIPEDRRRLVTAHDAFRYFGKRYSISVVGLQGISTETQVSLHDIALLADYLVKHAVPAVFVESSIPYKTMHAVQAATAARGHHVALGKPLLSDALGSSDHSADTYQGMMRYNVTVLVESLL